MTTAYDTSVRLVLWGDTLQPTDVARQLKLAPSFCEARVKGEVLKRPDGTSTGSVAKTGMLIYNCAHDLPDKRHDPEAQLGRIADVLRPLPDAFFASNGVEQTQLQMFFYYDEERARRTRFSCTARSDSSGNATRYSDIGLNLALTDRSIMLSAARDRPKPCGTVAINC
jgi:hypothetical protein